MKMLGLDFRAFFFEKDLKYKINLVYYIKYKT